MFRGRSDDKQNDSKRRSSKQTKGGSTPAEAKTNSLAGKRPGGARTRKAGKAQTGRAQTGTAQERQAGAGRTIRRIDDRSAGSGRPGDQTQVGGPPSGPPTQSSAAQALGSANIPGGLADRAPSLPPLKQPTGNIPRIPVAEVSPEPVVSSTPSEGPGVFGQIRPDSAPASADNEFQPVDGLNGPDGLDDAADLVPDQMASDLAVPLAADDSVKAERVGFGEESQFATASAGAVATAMGSADPFGAAPRVKETAAAAGRSVQQAPVDATRQVGAATAGSVDYGASREPEPLPPRSHRSNSGRGSGEHPQDTEFKLADGRQRQKPKEPNRLLLGLGIGLVLLLGAAAAWYFTRGDDDPGTAATDSTEAVTTTTVPAASEEVAAPGAAEDVPAEPAVTEPTLFFDQATAGPLTEGETYGIDLVGEPEGSLLQVIVDEIPQGEPDPLLPDLILPAGRHTLYIEITNGAEVTSSTPVELYVQGAPPVQGFRANLSSVDMLTEGWEEAIRQFDQYKAAGHAELQMYPISDGYWNIFVGGLGEERSAAQTYCESFSLAVPEECFPTYYDAAAAPAAPASDAGTDSDGDVMTDGEAGSEGEAGSDGDVMTDGEDATSTTVAGG